MIKVNIDGALPRDFGKMEASKKCIGIYPKTHINNTYSLFLDFFSFFAISCPNPVTEVPLVTATPLAKSPPMTPPPNVLFCY